MSLTRISVCAMSLFAAACALAADRPMPLNDPVCEPSAALVVPCVGKPGRCLLVGDNETADAVFLYSFAEGQLDIGSVQRIKLGNKGVDDIESMSILDNRTLLLLGSHSRNRSCEIRDARRRLMLVRGWGDGRRLDGRFSETPEPSAAALLLRKAAASPVLKAVGEAIDRAEAEAERAAKMKRASACDAAAAFNIEGAVALRGPAGDVTVWIGLRAPLVMYAGKRWAPLLRLEHPNALGLDQAILLDLGGRGVRELTLDGDWLWGIAGGPGDAERNFVLWRVRLGQLQPDARLHPEIVRALPDSSEGLAFVGDGKALVLIDGDRGEDAPKAGCRTPGAYLQLKVP